MGPRLSVILSVLLDLAILWLACNLASSAAANFQVGDQAAGWRDSFLALGQWSIAGGVFWKAVRSRP
ncbi:hypothetical protein [Deinococcus enclensis]|uniref:DUF378 domain-containing protein n=1 Tax=Deinococcus enclensis TaxID=1049582 RepID=A0ABT9MG61_9DEIO|nr:hypothetical protein [Deinococcus enclensis]MDP9765179.1 hypothetical protein [Deinococcus enclensis]